MCLYCLLNRQSGLNTQALQIVKRVQKLISQHIYGSFKYVH